MRVSGGWLQIGRWGRAPVRIHWSVALGAVLWTRGSFAPAYWVSFLGLVLAHELGHAWMVRRAGCQVVSIDAHGLGGQCAWRGNPTAVERSAIAWGGVLAQAIIGVIATIVFTFVEPGFGWLRQVQVALISTNIAMIVLNLLPIPPLDGAEAWALFPALYRRWRHRRGPPPPSRTRFDRETPFDAEVESERLLDEIRRDRLRRR